MKLTQKNDPELGDTYISFIFRSISFYRQHLKIHINCVSLYGEIPHQKGTNNRDLKSMFSEKRFIL